MPLRAWPAPNDVWSQPAAYILAHPDLFRNHPSKLLRRGFFRLAHRPSCLRACSSSVVSLSPCPHQVPGLPLEAVWDAGSTAMVAVSGMAWNPTGFSGRTGLPWLSILQELGITRGGREGANVLGPTFWAPLQRQGARYSRHVTCNLRMRHVTVEKGCLGPRLL